jgi:hypothetical protein
MSDSVRLPVQAATEPARTDSDSAIPMLDNYKVSAPGQGPGLACTRQPSLGRDAGQVTVTGTVTVLRVGLSLPLSR